MESFKKVEAPLVCAVTNRLSSLNIPFLSQGMIKTERGKHEGGDAAWEEQKLGSYKRSEVRLVDIQEGLCNDIVVGQDQCHALAESNEHLLDEWWFKEQGDTAGN